MKLKPGDKAINFSTTDIYGNPISLEDYKGKKLLLSFFRHVTCPFCNLRIHELNKVRESFEAKGLYMIFILESSEKQLRDSMFHNSVSPIPIISDPKYKLYESYGIESSMVKMMMTFFQPGTLAKMKEGLKFDLPPQEKDINQKLMPGDFLIDENQRIAMTRYGKHMRDHTPIYEIESYLQDHPLPKEVEKNTIVENASPKSKIKVIQPEEAEGKLKEIYDKIKDTRGNLAEVHKIQSLRPKSIVHHMNLYMEIMYSRSELSRAEREMMGVVVSATNNCTYCVRHHGDALQHYWKDPAKVLLLSSNLDVIRLSEKERLLCEFAREVTENPSTKEDWVGKLKNTELSDNAILDATLVVSYFNFVNRIVLTLGVPLENQNTHPYKY